MNTSPKNQTSQSGSSTGQPGQTDLQTGQSSQDNRYGGTGQNTSAPGQGQRQQGGDQSREVSAAARQDAQASRVQSTTTLLPPVDIYEDESGFTVMADMPGVTKDQLLVRVTGDRLLIEGTASCRRPATWNWFTAKSRLRSTGAALP